MATFEIGRTSISLPRGGSSEWSMWTKKEDAAFGPHFGFQSGLGMIYVTPTEKEMLELREWCNSFLQDPSASG